MSNDTNTKVGTIARYADELERGRKALADGARGECIEFVAIRCARELRTALWQGADLQAAASELAAQFDRLRESANEAARERGEYPYGPN